MAQENGWTPQKLDSESAVFRFDMPSGRSKAAVVLPFEHLFEFSVQSNQVFNSEEDIPHLLSSILLQRNSGRSIGFWSLLTMREQYVYTCMHNVEPRLMTGPYFGDVVRALLEEADRLDNWVAERLRTKNQVVVHFGEWRCRVEKNLYTDNQRLALILNDAEDGERITVATVNVSEARLAADEVVIKSYEGHESLPNAMAQAGVIQLTGRTVQVGQYWCPVAKCLI